MTVHVFLHDDYADWELGYLLPELRSPPTAPQIEKRPRNVATFSVTGEPVTSSGGLRVVPDLALADVEPRRTEALILPGGTFWRDFESAELDALVLEARSADAVVGAICAATGYLAQLGLLDDVEHASNSLAFLEQRAPDYAGQAKLSEALVARDGKLVTASGLAAIDFTYELLLLLDVYPREVADVWYRAFKHGDDPFRNKPS